MLDARDFLGCSNGMKTRLRHFHFCLFNFTLSLFLSGCQAGYLIKSAVSQADLLMKRVPVQEAINNSALSDKEKEKLKLAQEARVFAENKLGLKQTKNYTSFVQLDRPFVSYLVTAAPRTELKPYLWAFPMVGRLPYKGYFDPKDAAEEAEDLKKQGYDTFVRGVSAFSTLGWFRDPILSSMLRYRDHQLVNTIIHETVHATLYIRSAAEFNERLATFIGNKGTELFYLEKEGPESPTLQRIKNENADDRLFSEFISQELKSLETWYKERKNENLDEDLRRARLEEIRSRFVQMVKPKLSAGGYSEFEKGELNNARLIGYRTYFEDLSDFEAVFQSMGASFEKFLQFCRSLEREKNPELILKEKARSPQPG